MTVHCVGMLVGVDHGTKTKVKEQAGESIRCLSYALKINQIIRLSLLPKRNVIKPMHHCTVAVRPVGAEGSAVDPYL
jgi:hypothetical protein